MPELTPEWIAAQDEQTNSKNAALDAYVTRLSAAIKSLGYTPIATASGGNRPSAGWVLMPKEYVIKLAEYPNWDGQVVSWYTLEAFGDMDITAYAKNLVANAQWYSQVGPGPVQSDVNVQVPILQTPTQSAQTVQNVSSGEHVPTASGVPTESQPSSGTLVGTIGMPPLMQTVYHPFPFHIRLRNFVLSLLTGCSLPYGEQSEEPIVDRTM